MGSLRRVLTMGEMHGRDLLRHRSALALLVALPLSFYLSVAGEQLARPFIAGGVGMAFSVSGATLFSILSSREVDQRLVLSGYRPIELLLGRLLFLVPFGLVVAAGFSVLMSLVSDPARPGLLAFGVSAVAAAAVPFGLAVGAGVPRELEGTLVLIGVVGVQLASDPDAVVAKVLPFYGPQRLIEVGSVGEGAVLWPVLLTVTYSAALLLVARLLVASRVRVVRHAEIEGA